MTQKNIETLGILEQNLSSVVMQRQSLHKQVLEIDHALTELKQTDEAYQIVGAVMVKKSSVALQKELKEKKETIAVKLSSVQKQEETLRSQLQDMQKSVMAELKQGE